MILAAWEREASGVAASWATGLGARRVDGDRQPELLVAVSDGPGPGVFDDTEIVVAAEGVRAAEVASAYRREGIHCAARLAGDFDLVLYDAGRHLLFATSAITSHRQHAYWTDGKTTLVGTGVLGLLRHPATPRALDEVHLAHLVFGLQAMEPGSTPIAGVRRLCAGEALVVTDGDARVVRVDRLRAIPGPLRKARRIALFWSELESIVRREMAGDGKACLSLSGGLDSAAIGATVATSEQGIDAFAMVAPGLGPHDEGRAIDALERTWRRLRLRRVDCGDAGEYPDLDRLPLRDDPQLVPVALLAGRLRLWSAASEAGFGSVLDGEGGDELFDGLASPLDALRSGRWLSLARHLRSLPDRRAVVRRSLLLPMFGARATNALRSSVPSPALLLPAFAARQALEQGPVQIALEQRIAAVSRGSQQALVQGWLSSPVRIGSALSQDHLASAYGIRLASPLLRREVVELVLGLRPGDMLSTGRDRPFLRAAVADRVPAGVRDAPKDARLAEALSCRVVSSARARRVLGDERVRERLADWIRFEKVEAMLDEAAAGRLGGMGVSWPLECLVTFADWYARAHREYGVR